MPVCDRLRQVSRDTADNELSTLSLNSKQRNRTFPAAAVGSEEARLRAGLRPPLKLYVRISRIQPSTGLRQACRDLHVPALRQCQACRAPPPRQGHVAYLRFAIGADAKGIDL
jgi:hypothetical protein